MKKKCKHSKAIEQDGYCFRNCDYKDTYSIGYIESKMKTSNNPFFSIKIKNLVNWIGVGIVEKQ